MNLGLQAAVAQQNFQRIARLDLPHAENHMMIGRGAGYAIAAREDLQGTERVEAAGGRIVFLPFVAGKSTTKVIEKMTQV